MILNLKHRLLGKFDTRDGCRRRRCLESKLAGGADYFCKKAETG